MIHSPAGFVSTTAPPPSQASLGTPYPSAPERVVGEVAATVTGETARGEGGTFRLRPRWPSADQLDYVNKFATAGLLVLGLLVLAGYALRNPSGAFSVLVRGAAARAGVR